MTSEFAIERPLADPAMTLSRTWLSGEDWTMTLWLPFEIAEVPAPSTPTSLFWIVLSDVIGSPPDVLDSDPEVEVAGHEVAIREGRATDD